jgi:hypothetical protein
MMQLAGTALKYYGLQDSHVKFLRQAGSAFFRDNERRTSPSNETDLQAGKAMW